jgi:hypothetical protein
MTASQRHRIHVEIDLLIVGLRPDPRGEAARQYGYERADARAQEQRQRAAELGLPWPS